LTNDQPVDDYAVLNQGQLKNFVHAAASEINSVLLGGMGDQQLELATLQATWQSSAEAETISGLRGEYFDGITLSGAPAYVTHEQVDFDWSTGLPKIGVPPEDFSVRWTGAVVPPVSGAYTFVTLSDDGVRLWIDEELVIDRWNLHSVTTDRSRVINLQAGRRHSVRLEYYEHTIHSVIRLRWIVPGQTSAVAIPVACLKPPGHWEMDDYQVMNVGQLKRVARPFYDRLAAVQYSGSPLNPQQLYPWGASADDYAVVNIGQAKFVFSFDVAHFLYLKMDSDGDGLINSVELSLGTDPLKADSDDDGIADNLEVSLGLDPLVPDGDQVPSRIAGLQLQLSASASVTADQQNNLLHWGDLSNAGNHVEQAAPELQPQIVLGAINGMPVIRFDGDDDVLPLPEVMSATGQGEVFIVTRLRGPMLLQNVLACFGSGFGTIYASEGTFYNDFGSDDTSDWAGPGAGLFLQPHIFNSSISPDCIQTTRFVGRVYKRRRGDLVVFRPDPTLGGDNIGQSYKGDIAEVLVFNRVLAEDERAAIYGYLTHKYIAGGIVPSAPQLRAYVASSSHVDLVWGSPVGGGQTMSIVERQIAGGAFAVIATLDDTFSFTDTELTPGQACSYRVKFLGGGGSSGYSSLVSIVTPAVVDAVPQSGLKLWLRSTAGIPHSGPVSSWIDQSGQHNDAVQAETELQPQIVSDGINGSASIRFSGTSVLSLPDFMSGAPAGEIIALVRVGDKRSEAYPDHDNTLWNFGEPTGYYSDDVGVTDYFHYNGFGIDSSQEDAAFPRAIVSAYHVYGIASDGVSWSERYNGQIHRTAEGLGVYFGTTPELGNGLVGDFVEVLVYDRVLDSVERAVVENYLSQKYALASLDSSAPSLGGGLSASDITEQSLSVMWTEAMDNVGVSAYDVYVDRLFYASVNGSTLTHAVTGLKPATRYMITITARDDAGNVSEFSEPLIVVTERDTEAPSAPDYLTVFNTDGLVVLNWSPPSDNVAVFAYDVYRDGILLGSTTAASFVLFGLADDVEYEIRVRARDEAGNVSQLSAPLKVMNGSIVGAEQPESQEGLFSAEMLSETLYFQSDSLAMSAASLAVSVEPMIVLGKDFAVGLRSDGGALSWGSNDMGQLGTGSSNKTLIQSLPVPLRSSASAATAGILSVSAGRQHGLVITKALPTTSKPNPLGVLLSWGRNDSGQLGNNSTSPKTFASPVLAATNGLVNVIAADAGYAHSLAIKVDGTVWAWGANTAGQLGNNTQIGKKVPTPVVTSSAVAFSVFVAGYSNDIVAVSAGDDHSLALKADGSVWAWGSNTFGQLGTGNTNSSLVPVKVIGLPPGLTAKAISASKGFSVALLSDQTVRVWGRNEQGQLGNGLDTGFSAIPVSPSGLGSSVLSIAVGETHVLVRRADETVYGWGSNHARELSTLVVGNKLLIPALLPQLTDVALITAGSGRSAAMSSDGAVYVWGNPAGSPVGTAGADLGVGGSALGGTERGYRSTPVQLRDVKTAGSVYAGGREGAVIRANGRSYVFGRNEHGQAGTGDKNAVVDPMRSIIAPAPSCFAFGFSHALALADGKVFVSGDNTFGQLGDGTTSARLTPVALALSGSVASSPITGVAAGWNHSLILRQDGTVWAWGDNRSGQLGNNSLVQSLVPTQVKGLGGSGFLNGVIAVAAGESHSFALKADGTVVAWGANNFGQLGTTAAAVRSLVPVQVSGLPIGNLAAPPIIAIASGANHGLVVSSAINGLAANRSKVYAWGRGTYGQVGNGSNKAIVSKPVKLPVTGIVGVAAGENHSLARKSDGTVLAWGRNHRGQVGNGYIATLDAEAKAIVTKPIVVGKVSTHKSPAVPAIAAGFDTSYAISDSGKGTVFVWGDAAHRQLGYDPARLVAMPFRLMSTPADSDRDGLPDQWEFDNGLTISGRGEDDSDMDGLSNVQEYYNGTLPKVADSDADQVNDFADSMPGTKGNADSFNLSIVSGNNQDVICATVAPLPIVVSIGEPKRGIPIVVGSDSASIRLSQFNTVGSYGETDLVVTTNSAGEAKVFFRQADTVGPHEIHFSAGVSDTVTAIENAVAAVASDLDSQVGLPVRQGVKLWLAADSGLSADPVSGKVSQWVDRSGSGLAAHQADASLQPVLNAGAHLGRPAVRFDGMNDLLQVPNLDAAMSRYSLVWLMKPESLDHNQKIMSVSSGGFMFEVTQAGSALVGTDITTRMTAGVGTGQIPAGTLAANTWTLLNFNYDAGVGSLYKNGILVAKKTGMSAPSAWTALSLGTNSPDTLHGDVAEVILYDRALSAQDILTLRDYFFSKYDFYSDQDLDGRRDNEEDSSSGTPTITILSPVNNPSL
jgi:alpha-tubulin suppressor-like RCC1 family protein/chitodextrinase